MTKCSPFWNGVIALALFEFLGWLFYALPSRAEDAAHCAAYIIAILSIFIAALVVTVQGLERHADGEQPRDSK